MTISALPTPPSRQSGGEIFADQADAFVGSLPVFVTEMNIHIADINAKTDICIAGAAAAITATEKAAEAQAYAASAVNAPGTSATSTTSLTVSVASKTLTIQTGKLFVVGQYVGIASTASPLNRMSGVITAHNSSTGALTVNITSIEGTGTFAAWTVALAFGPVGTRFVNDVVQVVSTGTYNLVASTVYVLTVSSVLTLPASPAVGSWVKLVNTTTSISSSVNRNGQPIMSLAENLVLNTPYTSITLVYTNSTQGWVISL
jgi:hypothetical protein